MQPQQIEPDKSLCCRCSKVSVKGFVIPLLGLTVFFLISLLSSASKFSVIVDMSVKMKGNVAEVFNNIVASSSVETINGTIYLKPLQSHENSSNEVKMEKQNTTIMKDEVNIYGNNVATNVSLRQSKCGSCFHHNFNYVIQNERICKLNLLGESIELLILILTTHDNIQARSAIRATWLSYTKNNTANVRYVFLLGEASNARYREAVMEESKLFNDIIKEDFIDTYTNLTYKTIMGFKWAATKCEHAHYVMKTDDDMFVNVPNLLKVLKSQAKQLMSSVIGACHIKASPIRNKNSKWFASVNSYPEKFYPGFCSGTGYVTSMHVATEIYKISPSVPFFHLEDVYVSLCIKKLGFNLKGLPGFHPDRPKLDPCVYKGEKLITSHQLTPTMLQSVWNEQCLKQTL